MQEQIEMLPDSILIEGDWESKEIDINGNQLRPEPSQRVWNHSPDNFNWGYGGSGPAQLSLAILLKYLPKDVAVSLHQSFKFAVVSKWPQSDFTVTLNLKEEVSKIQTTLKKEEKW